jgi:hypothetical protein
VRIKGHEIKDRRGRKREVTVDFWAAFAWLPNVHVCLCPFQLLPKSSSSTRVLAVSKIVLNKVNVMLVWSSRPFPILGCLVKVLSWKKSVKE